MRWAGGGEEGRHLEIARVAEDHLERRARLRRRLIHHAGDGVALQEARVRVDEHDCARREAVRAWYGASAVWCGRAARRARRGASAASRRRWRRGGGGGGTHPSSLRHSFAQCVARWRSECWLLECALSRSNLQGVSRFGDVSSENKQGESGIIPRSVDRDRLLHRCARGESAWRWSAARTSSVIR